MMIDALLGGLASIVLYSLFDVLYFKKRVATEWLQLGVSAHGVVIGRWIIEKLDNNEDMPQNEFAVLRELTESLRVFHQNAIDMCEEKN